MKTFRSRAVSRRETIVATDRFTQAFDSNCVYKRIGSGSQTAIEYSMQAFGCNQIGGQVSGFRILGVADTSNKTSPK
ncbi:MAG: hypothetical protein PVI69_08630 [Desulfobacterales bacterium]